LANGLAERIEEILRPALADNLVGQLRLVVGKDLADAAAARVRSLA
jgi:hypothetical protein